MAVTVTSRPSTWSAVKNPVVYVFETTGGPFTNYRIEIEVFKAADNTSLTGGVKFSFSPDGEGNTYADISAILKAYLKAEWVKPASLNEKETDTSIEFYIKYQELYDGSATSVQDDVSNPRFAVFAALQIPSSVGNNLTDYIPESGSSTKKFLTVFERLKLWRGYPATLSFIYPDGTALTLSRKQYNASGAQIGSDDFDALDDAEDNAVNRIDLLSGGTLSSLAKRMLVQLIELNQYPLLEPDEWTAIFGSGFVAPTASVDDTSFHVAHESADNLTKSASQPLVMPAGATISFHIALALVSGNIEVYFYLADDDNITVSNTESIVTSTPGTTPHTISLTSTNPSTKLIITITITGTPFEASVELLDIGEILYNNVTPHSEALPIDVEDPCANPIMLVWKNSLGGDAWWMFDYDQEVSYNLSSEKKAKRLQLFTNNLTADQWEALNELNHIGEVYKKNITELTSSVDKSHAQDGTQVYAVDADGNKVGVIVIPKSNVMFTRMKRHRFELEIEFPERYE